MSTQSLMWAIENINTLTEDEALSLVQALQHKHLWVVTIWTTNDVRVTDEDGDELEWGSITQAEREALADTWEWRKGINDAQVSHTNEYTMPVIVRHEDGSFTVHGVDDEGLTYNADGTEKKDE